MQSVPIITKCYYSFRVQSTTAFSAMRWVEATGIFINTHERRERKPCYPQGNYTVNNKHTQRISITMAILTPNYLLE